MRRPTKIPMPVVRLRREESDTHVTINGVIVASFDVHKDARWLAARVRRGLRRPMSGEA